MRRRQTHDEAPGIFLAPGHPEVKSDPKPREFCTPEEAVDLVDQDPILDFPFIPIQKNLGVADKERDKCTVIPSAVFCHEIQGHLIMVHGDDRFHATADDRIDQRVIVAQAFFIWLRFIAAREDP